MDISKVKVNGTTYDIKDAAARESISQINTNLANYYQKSDTYSKGEVDSLLSAINQFEYVVSASLPTASADTMYKIYLVPSANSKTQNVKDEYITIENSGSYSWEQIGSTSVDLSDYITTGKLTTELAKKQDTISDLATIRSGAAAGATAYQKPSAGIPLTDLAQGVKDSLAKADSAIQSHQDISGKADKSATVSNVSYDTRLKKITKTIDDTTSDLVTASDLVTDGGAVTDIKYVAAGAALIQGGYSDGGIYATKGNAQTQVIKNEYCDTYETLSAAIAGLKEAEYTKYTHARGLGGGLSLVKDYVDGKVSVSVSNDTLEITIA